MITQPQPVQQENPEIILDENFANNRMALMRKLGAKNVEPPLAPSTHLKNKHTGVIFPWSAALAEHRDILVNCDAAGNTDPSVWKKTMLSDEQIPAQDDLMTKAYSNLRQPVAAPPADKQASAQIDGVEVQLESKESLTQLSNLM